jgi:hypothetical protein
MMRMIYLSILTTGDDIENSIAISESILWLSDEREMIFFQELFHVSIFISTRHLVEDDDASWYEKWQRPAENIIDIGSRTRDYDIILPSMLSISSKILGTSMDR